MNCETSPRTIRNVIFGLLVVFVFLGLISIVNAKETAVAETGGTNKSVAGVEKWGAEAGTGKWEAEEKNYFHRREDGYFWYKDEIETEKEKKPKKKPEPQVAAPSKVEKSKDPLEELEEFQKGFLRLRAKAVLHPTPENIKEYQQAQMEVLNRGSLFSDLWMRNVWANPELDYSLRKPTMQIARQTYNVERRNTIDQAIKKASKEYGLYYFFRGSCPYCKEFSPVLKMFSRLYDVKVIAVSLDGGGTPGFPQYRTDTRVANVLGVTTVPSLYLVNPSKKKVLTVTNGMIGINEIRERIYMLTQMKPGEDY